MARAALAVLLLALAAPASAQIAPHLIPEVGAVSRADALDRVIGETLDSLTVDGHSFAVDRGVIARWVSVGVGSPDTWVMAVRETPDGYVGLWALGSPWYDGRDEDGRWSAGVARRVPYRTGSASLDSALARAIGATWEVAVLGTRHQQPEEFSPFTAMDGSSAYYARWIEGYGVTSGWSRAALDGTPAQRLGRLSGMLFGYLHSDHRDEASRDELLAEAREVFQAFDSPSPSRRP